MTARKPPPHPPDETSAELRVALVRNHPELAPEEIDALLTGTTNKQHFRWRTATHQGWTAGSRAKGNGQGVRRRGRRKR